MDGKTKANAGNHQQGSSKMVVVARGRVEGVLGKAPGSRGSENEQKQQLPEIFPRQDQTSWRCVETEM